jgi:hypothetical protein
MPEAVDPFDIMGQKLDGILATKPSKPSDPFDVMGQKLDNVLQSKAPRVPESVAAPVAEARQAGLAADPAKRQGNSDEGFWSLAGRSFVQGAVSAGQETAAGAAASIPQTLGGSTVAQQAEQLPETDAADEITKLQKMPVSEGFTNSRWWGANFGDMLGRSVPSAALGAAGVVGGGALAGPAGALLGGTAGLSGGMALQTLVPAYKAARATGLDHDSALSQALIQTGIAGGFGVAMGIVGATPLTATTIQGALKRPITEALVKLGIAEPGLMVAQAQTAKAAAGGGWLSPDEAIKGYIMGTGVGAAMHGALALGSKTLGMARAGATRLTPEGLHRGFESTQERDSENLQETPVTGTFNKGVEFYNKVSDAVAKHPENALEPHQWHEVMKNAHASADNFELPNYLADDDGKIPKADLLGYIEGRGTWTQTTHLPSGDTRVDVIEPSGKSKSFASFWFGTRSDRDGHQVMAINTATDVDGRFLGNMKADPHDVIAHKIAEFAAMNRAEKIAWAPSVQGELPAAIYNLAAIFGMKKGTTRVDGWNVNLDYVRVSPVAASNIRQGATLFSRGPGTYMEGDPFAKGREAINGFLDRAQASQMPRSEWIQTPEGGLGMYMRLRREGDRRLVDIANLDFEKKSSGAFGHYLQHIENEAQRRGLHGVRVENIMNERLPKFLEGRGYMREQEYASNPEMPSMRKTFEPWHQASEALGRYKLERGTPIKDVDPRTSDWTSAETIPGADKWNIRDVNGNVVGYIAATYLSDTHILYINDIFTPKSARLMANTLGTKEILKMLSQLRTQYPEAEKIVGYRVTGARTGKASDAEITWRQLSEMAAGAKPDAFPPASPHLLTPGELKAAGRRVAKIIEALRKAMGMKAPVIVNMHEVPSPAGDMGMATRTARGYEVNVYLGAHEKTGAEGIFTTAAHEFGHAVMWHFFDRAPMGIKNLISNAFDNWRAEAPSNQSMNTLMMRRNAAVDLYYGQHYVDPDYPVLSLTPERQRYWNGFEEWFAEQVARWATTQEKPAGVVDRFFASLGRRVKKVLDAFRITPAGAVAKEGQPVPEMKAWLDSLVTDAQPFAADIFAAAQLRSLRRNQAAHNRAGEGDVDAVAETASTGSGRGLLRRLFGAGMRNPEVPAGADRMNRFYWYMISLPQLAKLNPHIDGLQRYRELVSMLHLEKVQMMNEAETTLHFWRGLMPKQADAVAGLIDDYMNMTYRTPEEINRKISRRPTEDEFNQLIRNHGVNDKGIEVFKRVTQDFDRMLDRYRLLLEQGAHEIEDPVVSAQKLEDIAAQIAQMRKAPYFPAMRFGNYTLTVRDNSGKVVHFETFEHARQQRSAHEAATREFPEDHVVRSGYLRKDVAPLVGMPPGLLDKIGDKLELSRSQRDALDELRFEYMPAQSFAHRFRRKKDVPGYSDDFVRAYAHYMFHGANYFTRAKYVDSLREASGDIRQESATLQQATKRDQIANFVSDHLAYLLNPKPDFTTLRSLMFHWALGLSPAAATLNLTQTALGTYPYLATKFGDAAALRAMAGASGRLSSFYAKMSLANTTDPQLKGIAEAVRQGVISETQANVLAATADGRVLSQGFGGNRAEKAFNLASRFSQFFFEMTEQTNRRVAFRAAWDLAMANPKASHVADMVRQNGILFESLRFKGFTEQEAGAFVAAKDAVDSTQYVYAPYARPRFMRGKLGNLFVFHSFTQNTLFYLWNNPGAAMRSLLMLGAAGGLMGLPGAEDVNGILRAIAYKLFGKDFDIQDEVRKFVIDVLDGGGEVQRPGDIMGSKGIRPDILLHGLSRVGYGIPAVMDMLGSIAGMGHVPMPVVDRHANIGMGNILPFEPGPTLAPQITGPGAGGNAVEGQAFRQIQRASGAMFGLGFAVYKALESAPNAYPDWKRWEGVIPTALRNAAQAFRYYQEGKARNAQGAALVRFDPSEPEHMAEIIGQALGYRPERLSAAWDRRTAERESEAFWDVRKQQLMQNAWVAKSSGDSQVYASALEGIRKFNKDLPAEARAKAITAEALATSFKNRTSATAKTEVGLPQARQNIPLARSTQRLYPEVKPAGRRDYPPQGGALGR